MASEGAEVDPKKRLVGQMPETAATLAAAGLRQAMGLHVGTPPGSSDPSWIERLLGPWRQALGGLAELMPRVLARVGEVADRTTEGALLFRARPAPDTENSDQRVDKSTSAGDASGKGRLTDAENSFWEFFHAVRESGNVLATPALYDDPLRRIPSGSKAVIAALESLSDDPRRLELPTRLEELKHDVRADRAEGYVKVHAELRWLLESDGRQFAEAYKLLEQLSDVLGERCLRELRRRGQELALLKVGRDAATKDHVTWAAPLRKCFATFGHPLSDRVSVIQCGPQHRSELLVMDHARHRWFEVRRGSDAAEGKAWRGGEIYGPEAGRDYRVGDRLPLKLPLRTHDGSQGFATWSIDRRLVEEAPDLFSMDAGIAMRTLDSGANRTPVAIFFVHYRDTDIGEYYELGLGCLVAPSNDPLSVGIAMLGPGLVSTAEAKEVSENVWGYRKEHVDADEWTVSYRPNRLACRVNLGPASVNLELPRGGPSFDSASPMLFYTRKPGRGAGQWHRSAAMRFASGESIRIVGSGVKVWVELEDEAKAFVHPFVKELYRLGLIVKEGGMRTRAMNAGWSQRIKADLGPPMLVPQPEPEFD